tara:strand:+ start:3431 stop:4666 length:1236 start_codon:yes stop_codon:yes gene_type:complete
LLTKIKNNENRNLVNFLLFFYLVSYIAGPAVINILITFLSFFSLIYLLKNRRKIFLVFKYKSSIVFSIFFFYIFLKNILFQEFNLDILSFTRIFTIFFFISLFSDIHRDYYDFKIKYFILIIIIISADTLFQFYYGYNILGFEKYSNDRLTSFFDDEPIVGSFIMKLMFPIIIYLYFTTKNIYLILLIIFLSSIAVILSGERMPFLQLLFGFFLCFFLFSKINFKSIISLILISTISIFILVSQNNVKDRYTSVFVGLSSLFSDLEKSKNIMSDEHRQYGGVYDYYLNFQSGLTIWSKNYVFGNGYRYYKDNCKKILEGSVKEGCSTHPHNIYIELLSDHGIIGFLLFSLFICSFIIEILKRSDRKEYFGLLITIILISFPFVTSQSIFSSYYGSIYFFYFFALKLLINKK